MSRLVSCFALSVFIYIGLFAFILDRPLSLGLLRLEIAQKTARLDALPSPKLVILAGSNGPYSHSCAVLGAMLAMPCENAGIAVGMGLDEIFARYGPSLRPGDVVYMPMELQQYAASLKDYSAAPDAGILLRYDRRLLPALPTRRFWGALFCCSLLDFLESSAEMPLAYSRLIDPQSVLAREYNPEGDRIDNEPAAADPALRSAPIRLPPPPEAIEAGYGTSLIATFVQKESAAGVTVIGGLPTDFRTVPISDGLIRTVAAIYLSHGGQFLVLPNRSQYPVDDFFNSEDHLSRPCQYAHTVTLAVSLGQMLNRRVLPPPSDVTQLLVQCPQT